MCLLRTFSIVFLILFCQTIFAQDRVIKYEIETQTIGTSSNVIPFWMRSNQYGSIPLSGISGSLIGRVYKDYNISQNSLNHNETQKRFDWGFGFEGRANAGKGSNLQLIEAYGKFMASIFQLKVGRSKDVMGLNGDTALSSGSFAISGNAPGIPKIEISIPEYWTIPILNGLFSIKGNFVHGWIGQTKILDSITNKNGVILYHIENNHPITYFHQKSFYVRFGKPNWRLELYGGFNHQVYWGNESSAYGENFKLSSLETFRYVVTGRSYGTTGVPRSKIGNQLGSIDAGVEYDFENLKVMLYRQNFYDIGALSKLANIRDGLNGLSFENKKFNATSNTFRWKKIIAEFFYSKDQAGYPWSIQTNSGAEDYYNNYYYEYGWTYRNIALGNPLITLRKDARPGQEFNKALYFINNRVVAFHFGLEGKIKDWSFISKLTYSQNYGTFNTSIYGRSINPNRPLRTTNIFIPVKQFSFYLEGMKPFKNNFSGGFAAAFDQGELLNNSFGIILKLRKSFLNI